MERIPITTPGEILKSEFLKPNRLSVNRVAKDIGVPQPTLQLVVTGRRSISAELALKLGIYFGMEPQFWMNLQAEHDLRVARAKFGKQLKEVHPLARAA